MNALSVITTNDHKFHTAETVFHEFGLAMEQVSSHDIEEIQGEDAETIIQRKAADAFALVQKPLVVTDDSWEVAALKGFPGPYMKSVSGWFTVEDWLRLMKGVEDRRILLRQMVAYQDELECVTFSVEIEGILLDEARGEGFVKSPAMAITSFDGGKTTVGENARDGKSSTAHMDTAWHALARWIKDAKPGMYEL